MVQSTRVNGLLNKMEKAKRMVEVFKYGLMDPVMTVSGEMVWLMVMVVWSTLRATSMKGSGPKIRLMAMVFILISMAVATKASGLQTNNMVLAWSNGPMAPNMTVNMSKE